METRNSSSNTHGVTIHGDRNSNKSITAVVDYEQLHCTGIYINQ